MIQTMRTSRCVFVRRGAAETYGSGMSDISARCFPITLFFRLNVVKMRSWILHMTHLLPRIVRFLYGAFDIRTAVTLMSPKHGFDRWMLIQSRVHVMAVVSFRNSYQP